MILYFSGTGNSLAISRHIAEKLNETVMPLSQAVHQDLSRERRIGLVYPSYWFNAPRAVTELLPRLHAVPRLRSLLSAPGRGAQPQAHAQGAPVPPPEGDGGGYETVVFHATWKDCP